MLDNRISILEEDLKDWRVCISRDIRSSALMVKGLKRAPWSLDKLRRLLHLFSELETIELNITEYERTQERLKFLRAGGVK